MHPNIVSRKYPHTLAFSHLIDCLKKTIHHVKHVVFYLNNTQKHIPDRGNSSIFNKHSKIILKINNKFFCLESLEFGIEDDLCATKKGGSASGAIFHVLTGNPIMALICVDKPPANDKSVQAHHMRIQKLKL